MKKTFRQSMASLHTWAGLLVGWLLFFIFLTGTFGYVNAEVDRWMRPELPMGATLPPAADLIQQAQRRLQSRAPDAAIWSIGLPGKRRGSDIVLSWRNRPAAGEKRGAATRESLDVWSGAPSPPASRATGGGNALYVMHYALHYMPQRLAYYIVGICTMFMLVAVLTGIIVHKNILRQLFTFRPGTGQRSWLDGHTLLATSVLPFFLMMTWSGLVFFVFIYMPVALFTLYPQPDARDRAADEILAIARPERGPVKPAATLASLAPLLERAEDRWGRGAVASVTVTHPGRVDARITFHAQATHVSRNRDTLDFDGATGRPLDQDRAVPDSAAMRFSAFLLGLHEGNFAGPALRLLYVLAGIAGSATIGTGLLLWSAKRTARMKETVKPGFGVYLVDRLNLSTLIGLPIGVAAYFWANRLIPSSLSNRAEWEVHAMFIAWGVAFITAFWRSRAHAWIGLTWLAAFAWGALPMLNALTTQRHLGVSMRADDWELASIDLGMLAAGLFFAFLARGMRRRQRARAVPGAIHRHAAVRETVSEVAAASFLDPLRQRRILRCARAQWSVASRILAAVAGGYAMTSLINMAVPLLLAQLGVNVPQALLATTMTSYLLYAGIMMAAFHARCAGRAWAWIGGTSLLLGGGVWMLFPGAAP